MQAGEYEIEAGESMASILDKVTEGRVLARRVIVPEGLTSYEIVGIINAKEELVGDIAEIPAEGTLAPNTYDIRRGETRASLIERMQTAQTKILSEAWEGRADALQDYSQDEILILASIIEKETRLPEERGQVSSVLLNRLQKNMRLEMDPTVVYGVTGGKGPLGRGLRRSELDKETPYNTYKVFGLPPTPITNPGRASIEAAANPDDTDFIFFVADGTGGHFFSVNYEDHRKAVRDLRQREREQKEAAENN